MIQLIYYNQSLVKGIVSLGTQEFLSAQDSLDLILDPIVDSYRLDDVNSVKRAMVLEELDGLGLGLIEVFNINPKLNAQDTIRADTYNKSFFYIVDILDLVRELTSSLVNYYTLALYLIRFPTYIKKVLLVRRSS